MIPDEESLLIPAQQVLSIMDMPLLTNVSSFIKKLLSLEDSSPRRGWFSFLVPIAIAICLLVITAAGFVLSYNEDSRADQRNQQQSTQLSITIAGEISLLVQNQVALLESVVQDPSLVQVFAGKDDIALTAREHQLTYLFPGALRVRLLRPGIAQTDEKTQPPLGFAALSLLREAEIGRVPSTEVHLAVNGKRNIAVVRPVVDANDKHVLGNVLIQSSVDPLVRLLDVASRGENLVVLTQEVGNRETTIYHKGDGGAAVPNVARQSIPGTRWHLAYRINPDHVEGEPQSTWIGEVLSALAVVVTLLLLWVQYVFRKSLQADVNTIVTAIQDIRDGRFGIQYIVSFDSLSAILESVRQSAQVLGQVLHQPQIVVPAAPKREFQPARAPEPDPRPTPSPPPPEFSVPPAPLAPASPPVDRLANSAVPPNAAKPIASPSSPPEPTPKPAPKPISALTPTPKSAPVPDAKPSPSPPPTAAEPPVVVPSLVLLDLEEDVPPVVLPPVVATVTAPVRSASETSLELSFLDADLSAFSSGNKATVTLPKSSASSPATLAVLEPKGVAELTPNKGPTVSTHVASSSSSSYLPPDLFRAYDIRGVADQSLTVGGVYELARSIGSEAQERGQQRIVVARDGRISGLSLGASLVKGLRAAGCDVIDLGQVPTPLLYFATRFLDTKACVMLTASHHPAQWNGLRVMLQGEDLAGDGIQKLRKRVDAGQFATGEGGLQAVDVVSDYLAEVTTDIQVQRPLRLVVDCGNGVAGALAPQIYRALGCDVVPLFCDVDGHFPNHPADPSQPNNLRTLISTVKTEQADLGFAFAGDGNRMVVVDSSGAIFWPDRLMMLFANDLLPKNPGATVVFDVKSSAYLPQIIKKHGGRPLLWKTGHSFIKAKMKEADALFAGEMSGHLFFKGKEHMLAVDDAFYAGARLLELLSRDSRPPHEVFAALPPVVSTPELRLDLPKGENGRIMDALDKTRARLSGATITRLDGLRADFDEGWGLVRASNSTPSLVFRFEARTPQALRRIQDEFRRILLEAGPGLKLPF